MKSIDLTAGQQIKYYTNGLSRHDIDLTSGTLEVRNSNDVGKGTVDNTQTYNYYFSGRMFILHCLTDCVGTISSTNG